LVRFFEDGRSLMVGIVLTLLPFVGIFTVESFSGKMVCLGIAALISLLIFNYYNQCKKKQLEKLEKELKRLKEEVKKD